MGSAVNLRILFKIPKHLYYSHLVEYVLDFYDIAVIMPQVFLHHRIQVQDHSDQVFIAHSVTRFAFIRLVFYVRSFKFTK